MGMGNIATTGMQASMSNMEVISNNIANANTGGFKKSTASFADIFPSGNEASGAQIGIGVTLDAVQQDFSPGGYQATGLPANMAIAGSGFFILRNSSSGQVSYSRYGNFELDESTGYLVNGNNRLQGFPASNGVIPAGTVPSDLRIDTTAQPAQASTTVTANGLNLNSGDPIIPAIPAFSISNQATYNYTTQNTIYDSLGNPTNLNLYYAKTAANTWNVYAAVNGSVINSGSPGALSFNSSGQLTSSTGLSALAYTPTTGAAAMSFAVDTAGTTQFGSPDSTLPFTTNGFASGIYTNFQMDNNGIITAVYSNGPPIVVGQVALATFQSPQNLQNLGGSQWLATTTSGVPIVNTSNSSNNLRQGQLETSNVDLATELVNLINAQNTFQANAQVEQTYNQVMQTVTKL